MPSLKNFKPFWSMSCPHCQRRDQRIQSFLRPANGWSNKLIRLTSLNQFLRAFNLDRNFSPRKIHVHHHRMINYMFEGPLASWEERMPNIQAFGGWVWNPNKMFNGNFTQNSTLSDTVWDGNQKNTKKKLKKIHQSLTNKAIKPIFDVGSFLIGAWRLRTF